MRKWIGIGLLFSAVAIAQVGGSQSVAQEAQSTTRSAPALADFTTTSGSSIGKSLDLANLLGFRVMVCAESGQTLSGAGNLRAYLLDLRDGLVKRNPSIDLAVTASSVRCQVFPDQEVLIPYDLVMYAADGVTVSGGTTVTVQLRGWRQPKVR